MKSIITTIQPICTPLSIPSVYSGKLSSDNNSGGDSAAAGVQLNSNNIKTDDTTKTSCASPPILIPDARADALIREVENGFLGEHGFGG
ncbi:hypothetical protein JTE90_001249 [Oedothorax gibbosus]|uniref:Uncharacterized protein n=1 Tax=Oedothorax gibbosus TaxID=931172 RepID=A0AAV6VVC9_9ARAC|nr:hypothetical protein JTE90_001249 [Oedothorax gibbosus]